MAQYSLTYRGNNANNANPRRFETAMKRSYFRFDQVTWGTSR